MNEDKITHQVTTGIHPTSHKQLPYWVPTKVVPVEVERPNTLNPFPPLTTNDYFGRETHLE